MKYGHAGVKITLMYTFSVLRKLFIYACVPRLLSWTGQGIQPVGVDYVLQKLGFSHARTTIPKWIQRGIMDPCDLMCSSLINSLIEHMAAKRKGSAAASSTLPTGSILKPAAAARR